MAFLEQLMATFYSLAVLLDQTLTLVQDVPESSSGLKRLGFCAYNFRWNWSPHLQSFLLDFVLSEVSIYSK